MVNWITGTKCMLCGSNHISIAHFSENFITLTFIVFVAQRQLLDRKVCFLSQPSFEMTGYQFFT